MGILNRLLTVPFGLALLATSSLGAGDLPDPDGKPADMSKPVQVFTLMGQSNMLGMGKIAMGQKASGTGKDSKKGAETGNDAEKAAAEKAAKQAAKKAAVDITAYLEHAVKTEKLYPFMVDEAGNWTERKDVRNVRLMYNKEVEFGMGVYVNEWLTVPAKAKTIGPELDTYYPGAKSYEVAGFFWWQCDKDTYSPEHAKRYEENLVRLIEVLRKDFDAPNAKFVCATLAQTEKGATGNEGDILNGQLAVDCKSGKYPQFKGNVATVYSHPLSLGGASNSHYGGNAKTYMNIGLAMGEAMVEQLKGG